MKNTATVLAALAIGAVAIGLGIAPPAAADVCQTVGQTKVCGQGGVKDPDLSTDVMDIVVPQRGCLNAYGAYQNCNVQ